MIAAPGTFVYLASITFCAIIATGYSVRSVRCLIFGKATEMAVNACADFTRRRIFMSNKMLILAAIIVMVALSASTNRAQDQTQAPAPSSSGAVDSQGIRNYLLGPGDVLDVRVFGQSDLSSVVEIDSDGNVSSLPFLETPIRAQCRTEKEVQNDIALAYSKY